jgi:protein ImuB
VQSWAGPWPITERWWDPAGRVLNRFQLVDPSGSAWLFLLEDHRWWAEATYD